MKTKTFLVIRGKSQPSYIKSGVASSAATRKRRRCVRRFWQKRRKKKKRKEKKKKERKEKKKKNKSSKDRTWSAVPVALLGQFCLGCGEGAGQRPQRADVL